MLFYIDKTINTPLTEEKMKKTINFVKDITSWAKEVSGYTEANKTINAYQRGLITLDETLEALHKAELEHIKNTFKNPPKKLSWRDLKVGDKFIWIVDDFDGYSEDVCEVKEICNNHLLAYNCTCNIPDLWIDDDANIKEVA